MKSAKKVDVRFVIVFGCVWIAFGTLGLITAPERLLVAISQLVAGLAHFGYAYWLMRLSRQ